MGTLIGIILGGVFIYFLITLLSSAGEADLQKEKKEEQEIRDAENAERRRLEFAFIEWQNKLNSSYAAIEKGTAQDVLCNLDNLYKSIWNLEKVQEKDQAESRYKITFDQRLSNHIKWLRNSVHYCLQDGYYALEFCGVVAARCLKKAYHDDANFDLMIETLTRLYERAQSSTFYLESPQYGECKLPVISFSNQEDLDTRISTLKDKLHTIDAALQKSDAHYGNIIPDTANYIDYAAELMWCIAVKKPFNQDEFNEACELLAYNTRRCSIDGKPYAISKYQEALSKKNGQNFYQLDPVESLLALIYAKNLIGGANTANQEKRRIFNWIDNAIYFGMTDQCSLIPSALAWIGLYELERDVLRYLVEQKVNLSEELQDRLGFLESGGTSNIKIYDIDSDSGFLYDSSALEWNTDAFNTFFRKLEMTHKTMRYSLAISRWTKTLPLARGQKVTQEQIGDSFDQLVADFDGEVIVSREKAKALNLANVEYENSFIFRFTTERNRCVSILFSSEKYGRNLNLTIIVLFTPESALSSEELQKYALAIKDNIYVESFRESILQAVDEVIKPEQVIYDGEQSNGADVFE